MTVDKKLLINTKKPHALSTKFDDSIGVIHNEKKMLLSSKVRKDHSSIRAKS